jgi:CO/xanthine dehydrogenase Mo-binding subunit
MHLTRRSFFKTGAAAAVANAVFAATGQRIRRLPIRAADLRAA